MCITCVWHSFIPIVDTLDLFVGYDNLKSNSLFNSSNNQTLARKRWFTTGELVDKYAFFTLVSLFIGFHIVFGIWMYLSVNNLN